MSDLRDDYKDIDRPPDAGPKPDQTGVGPHDRILIAGWCGLFMGFGPGVVALLYLGRPDRWTARDATVAFGTAGVLTGLYMLAGGLLVIRGAQSKPVQGDAVRYFNLLIVGPLLAIVILFVLGPYVLLPVLWFQGGPFGLLTLAQTVMGVPLLVWQTTALVRHRRKIIPALRGWLDPTE